MKILADAHIPYLKGVAEQFGEVEYLPGNQFTREAIKEKDALIVRTVTHFGEEILTGTNVKLICSATIGFDHIDTAWCDAHGVAWRTAPGCNAASVEQYVTASLLYLADKYQLDLTKKTIGIVGVGNVGSKVDAACNKLGMRVLLNDPPREENEGPGLFTDIETIQREADFITFHTPLTKTGKHKTFHLADDRFLSSATKRPFIINAARGGVADNQALKRAIHNGNIAGVVIDCWENEPEIDRELLQLADIATPHIAGYSADGKWTATKMSLENLNKFFNLSAENIHYQEIPSPLNPIINLQGIDSGHQLQHAVWHTYNPMKETTALKSSPEKFYWFRSNYPLRREYRAYTVFHADDKILQILLSLGFNEK
ncbi:Erythronate-4-phosphate dehydrogenase [Proteiniphilum saccharofermentans]|jgi:erythronate-4-phosphate dehydrogenase|uniref:Erythronate-4-phosphate dehydrogenase n=1 Tax=Proteiniphilum saccharofermentans TaxID=1642647 RepID=A0A1R3T5Z1_9BACT|nr:MULTISPECIES: 4-phosphoerythronate dehydrogenase PdxB [Proteiniphilum]MDY9919896.1 4-phosphoerythronate dehydrogenase PdxB [Proteiniphilum sp.]SCD20718.1 Erythronate-4-phosphate dehydrogenase [Proteiniphilum saccharofermentans]SEA47096.1 erythronate-4-phosphate dehydrogenase [Porphyromonadaceae bacterium KH3R12]